MLDGICNLNCAQSFIELLPLNGSGFEWGDYDGQVFCELIAKQCLQLDYTLETEKLGYVEYMLS